MEVTDKENVDKYSSIKLSTNPSQKEDVDTDINDTITSKLASKGRTAALESDSFSLFSSFSISLLAMIASKPKI